MRGRGRADDGGRRLRVASWTSENGHQASSLLTDSDDASVGSTLQQELQLQLPTSPLTLHQTLDARNTTLFTIRNFLFVHLAIEANPSHFLKH